MSDKENVTKEEYLQQNIEKSRFKYSKRRSFTHASIAVLITGYAAYLIFIHSMEHVFSYIFLGVLIFSHIADEFIGRKNYNNNKKLLIACKVGLMASVMLFGATFGLHSAAGMICMAVYVLYYLEYIECIEFTNTEVRDGAAVAMAAIFAGCYIIIPLLLRFKLPIIETTIFVGIICIAFYSLIHRLYYYMDRYVSHITYLNRENLELESNNTSLNEQSHKIKEVIDLLGVQKIELSKANETINKQNAGMALHNKILGFVSAEVDMVKFSEKVVEALIESGDLKAVGMFIDALMRCEVNPLICSRISNKTRNRKSSKELEEIFNSKAEDILKEVHYFDDNYITDNGTLPELYKFLQDAGVKSLLRIQILTEGGMCGALILGSEKADFFTEESKQLYYSIATQIGIAVRNANMYATMENLATRDGLTGIYNRRHFNKLFSDYVTDAIENKAPLAVALFDIDKFKNVNDTYGHSFGDMVIVSVAQTANREVNKHGGILGRYGGEEFMMAFYDMDVEGIMPIVKKIHEDIKSTELTHNGEIVKINVSIGVTAYPSICAKTEDLLNHADWAMYYSKLHGRGRITVDSDEVIADSIGNTEKYKPQG